MTSSADGAGVASAMSETASKLGGALGIAVLGSLGTAIYRIKMNGAIPDGLAPDIAAAAQATIASAVDASGLLPAATAEPFLISARAAFSAGMRVAAILAAIGMLVAAVATFKLLRNVRLSPQGGTTTQ